MLKLTLYSKKDCHLCDIAKKELNRLGKIKERTQAEALTWMNTGTILIIPPRPKRKRAIK